MIFNFYSYLFFAAMVAGAAIALLIHTIRNTNRRLLWDVNSISFLILLITSLISLIAGFLIIDDNQFDLIGTIIFYLIVLLIYIVAFYFLRAITLPITLFVLLGAFFLFFNLLSGYTSFRTDDDFSIKVLQKEDDIYSIEIENFEYPLQFHNVSASQLIPLFSVLDFPDYLFVLDSTSYIKFEGFLSDIKLDYLDAISLDIPFASVHLYSSKPLDTTFYSSFDVVLNSDGTINFSNEN